MPTDEACRVDLIAAKARVVALGTTLQLVRAAREAIPGGFPDHDTCLQFFDAVGHILAAAPASEPEDGACKHHPTNDCGCYCRFVGCSPETCPPTDEAAFWHAHGGRRLLSNKVRADDYRRDLTKAEADWCDVRAKLDAANARAAELEAKLDATEDERAVLKAVSEVGPRALKNPRTYGEDFAEVCEAALAWRKAKAGT